VLVGGERRGGWDWGGGGGEKDKAHNCNQDEGKTTAGAREKESFPSQNRLRLVGGEARRARRETCRKKGMGPDRRAAALGKGLRGKRKKKPFAADKGGGEVKEAFKRGQEGKSSVKKEKGVGGEACLKNEAST